MSFPAGYPKQISNVHTHTTFCDGENTPREMAEAAVALGFTDIGFSSHSPAPFDPGCPGITDEAAYRAAVAAVKAEFAGRLGVLCGVEQDFYAPVHRREDYDYVVGSVHYLRFAAGSSISKENSVKSSLFLPDSPYEYGCVDAAPRLLREMADIHFGGDIYAMISRYYETYLQNVKTHRPEVGGHFDLVVKFNTGIGLFDEESPKYKIAALAAADEVAEWMRDYGGCIEVNTGAMCRGYRETPYPAPFILKHLAAKKARMIITADSHAAATLNYGYEAAVDALRGAGFRSMAVLQGGAFVDVKL